MGALVRQQAEVEGALAPGHPGSKHERRATQESEAVRRIGGAQGQQLEGLAGRRFASYEAQSRSPNVFRQRGYSVTERRLSPSPHAWSHSAIVVVRVQGSQ